MPFPSRLSLDRVVSTARELLEEGGVEAVGMREVARRLDVRAPSLYLYVESRADLLSRLIELGLRELAAALADGVDPAAHPAARLHGLAEAYTAFAAANPGLFSLVMGPCPEGVAIDPAAGATAAAPLLDAVAAVLPRGAEPLPLSQALWSLVHGFTALSLAGQFRMGGDPQAAMHGAIDRLLDSQ